jgi:hypothetical protein
VIQHYIYFTKDNNNVYSIFSGFYSDRNTNIPNGAIPISDTQWKEYLNILHKEKLLWLDNNKKIQIRNKYTKWDSATESWIVDTDAETTDAKIYLIGKAQFAFNSFIIYTNTYFWNKYTPEQQQKIIVYLDELEAIIENKSKFNILPTQPDFIKAK